MPGTSPKIGVALAKVVWRSTGLWGSSSGWCSRCLPLWPVGAGSEAGRLAEVGEAGRLAEVGSGVLRSAAARPRCNTEALPAVRCEVGPVEVPPAVRCEFGPAVLELRWLEVSLSVRVTETDSERPARFTDKFVTSSLERVIAGGWVQQGRP